MNCAHRFEVDRDGGAHETLRFTIGHCGACESPLLHVFTPYGPRDGSMHPLTPDKHAQLLEGTDVDLEIFRTRWLEDR